ncbi:MAG: glycosyl transferase, partial [Kineothrix sp.]
NGNGSIACSEDFRSCSGTAGAAEFIENAPHSSDGVDVIGEVNKVNGRFQFTYWFIIAAMIILVGIFVSWKYVWMIGPAAGILSTPIGRIIQKKQYATIIAKLSEQNR